ncbi:substrate-binding domain-containing protein [Streptomyces sp. NPDC060205]|uniref:substrate-binding domain-containing protein n=1 Tax=Streptomyces sp. NPDC060205 TaxID=3347072 RepID=UPI00364BC046
MDNVLSDPSSVCGTKPMIIGIADGLGQNSWSTLSYELVEEQARKCPNTTKVIRTAANGDPSKAVSDINTLVAQGANVITVVPDAGPVGSAMRKAMESGVAVVTWGAPAVGAQVGRDMIDNIQIDRANDGLLYGEFLVEALDGKGNVLLIGGPAGNPLTPLTVKGVKEAFTDHPGMKILNKSPAITNWDPASTQQAVATLLTRFPKIDGIVTESVQNVPGIIQAFSDADRELVPITVEDGPRSATDLRLTGGCLYLTHKPSNPKLELAATSSGNFVGQIALRKAIASYQGTTNSEPSILKVDYLENSLKGGKLTPKCG